MNSIRKTQINRRRTTHLTRKPLATIAVLIGTTVIAGGTALAAAPETGWYGNLNLGRSNIDNASVDGAFANQGITSASSVDKNDTVYSLGLGYQFSRNFALEGGYTDFGKFNVNSRILAPAADLAHGDYKIDGWNLSAVGIIPLQSGFSVYGKAGVFYSDVKLNAASNTGTVPVSGGSERNTDGTWGLGLGYDFGNNLIGKLEWNRYQSLGDSGSTGELDINTYTAGVSYRF